MNELCCSDFRLIVKSCKFCYIFLISLSSPYEIGQLESLLCCLWRSRVRFPHIPEWKMVSCHIHYSARLFTFSFLGCEESEFEPFLVQNGRFVFLILIFCCLQRSRVCFLHCSLQRFVFLIHTNSVCLLLGICSPSQLVCFSFRLITMITHASSIPSPPCPVSKDFGLLVSFAYLHRNLLVFF